jgi:hypothetical protein
MKNIEDESLLFYSLTIIDAWAPESAQSGPRQKSAKAFFARRKAEYGLDETWKDGPKYSWK